LWICGTYEHLVQTTIFVNHPCSAHDRCYYLRMSTATRKRAGSAAKDARPSKKAMVPAWRSNTVAQARTALGVETKSGDQDLTTTQISSTNGTRFVMSRMSSGTESYQRVGRKITVVGIRVRGIIRRRIDNSDAFPQNVRMIIYLDKNGNGDVNFNDICGYTNFLTGGEGSDFTSSVKFDRAGRYKILRDKVWNMGPVQVESAGAAGTDSIAVDEYLFFKPGTIVTEYSGATNAASDISQGAVGVMFITDNQYSTTEPAIQSGTCRLWYRD